MKQLVASDKAAPSKGQHQRPCSDCPWARTALNGWLGGMSSDEWLTCAHGDARVDCHVLAGAECAGAAIYRANVCKSPRDRTLLRLASNDELVFSSPMEFREHHAKSPTLRRKR